MGINIPTYSDELTADITSLPSDHSRPSITSIPPALSKACEMSSRTDTHSSKNEQVRLNSSRENITYLKSNYVHFLSTDCEFVTPVSRLLANLGAVDPQDLKDRKPKIGEVLVTPRRHFNVYSLIIKQNHFEQINEEYIKVAVHNLRIALEKENISEFRISKYGDISDSLPKGQLRELLTQEFVNSKIEITICCGNVNIPPEELRTQIISENHESKIGGHKGINKTYQRIRERYTWPGLKDQVTEFVRKCDIRQKQKIVRAKIHKPMLITDTSLDTFDKVSLNTVGKLPTTPDGNKHILTMQDSLFKYCIAVPIPDISATTVAHAIARHLFSQHGAPRAILTNRGGSFLNNLLRKLSKIFGVKQITTSGYRPQSNGSLERTHAVLIDYIRAYAETYDDWDQLLPFAMFAYNTSVHEATKFTPFEVVFSKIASSPSSFPDLEKLETYGTYLQELILRLSEIKLIAARNLITAKEHSKENYDQKVKPFLRNVEDQVYIKKEAKTHGKLDNTTDPCKNPRQKQRHLRKTRRKTIPETF